MTDNADSPELT